VACSSAFPFLFEPQDLLARDASGNIVPFSGRWLACSWCLGVVGGFVLLLQAVFGSCGKQQAGRCTAQLLLGSSIPSRHHNVTFSCRCLAVQSRAQRSRSGAGATAAWRRTCPCGGWGELLWGICLLSRGLGWVQL